MTGAPSFTGEKMETQVWKKYEEKWASGNFEDVFIHGKPAVRENGTIMFIPNKLLALMPEIAKTAQIVADQKSVETARRLKAAREEREKRLDEDGFVLLAGEDTEVVYSGTWRQCRDNLWRLIWGGIKYPRDPYSGKGCWIIVKEEFEAQSGYFDADMYW
jgi:hypothetical protein